MKYILPATALLLMFLFSGCNRQPEQFALTYTMESAENYKMSIEIDKDRRYLIRQQNIFFDKYAGIERINTSEGQMTDEEYDQLSELVSVSRLFKMKDAYGFKQESDPDNPFDGFIYQIIFTEGKKTKYISIRDNPTNRFPDTFLQLLRFLSNYMSDHSSL